MEDQWKLDGDCEKCRRQSYCSRDCKKRRLAKEKAAFMEWAETDEGKAFVESVMKQYEPEDDNNDQGHNRISEACEQ